MTAKYVWMTSRPKPATLEAALTTGCRQSARKLVTSRIAEAAIRVTRKTASCGPGQRCGLSHGQLPGTCMGWRTSATRPLREHMDARSGVAVGRSWPRQQGGIHEKPLTAYSATLPPRILHFR